MATRDITSNERAMSARTDSPTVVRRQETVVSDDGVLGHGRRGRGDPVRGDAGGQTTPRAWTLVAAVVIGGMVSRGLAKSGSA